MAVGTVGCDVVDLCGSNSFPILKSTTLIAFVVLFVVVCEKSGCIWLYIIMSWCVHALRGIYIYGI